VRSPAERQLAHQSSLNSGLRRHWGDLLATCCFLPCSPPQQEEAAETEGAAQSAAGGKSGKPATPPPAVGSKKDAAGAKKDAAGVRPPGLDGPDVPAGQKLVCDAALAPTHLVQVC
jgi:hypothetical protein